MEGERFQGFADYYGQTQLHPLALGVTILLALFVLWSSRRHALVPLLLAAATLPMAQRLVIAGADFTLVRLLLIAYVIRIVFRQEWASFQWNRLDTAILLWVVSGATIMTIHYGTVDVLVNRAGWAYDIVLSYFVGRILIRRWDDLLVLARAAAVISVPSAALFMYEWLTQYNMFHVFGGVREITWVREGRLRCQGPFAHPIIAGAFWVALLPLIWTLWKGEGQSRGLLVIGSVCALLIVASTASSTPVLAVMAAAMGAALFVIRDHRTKVWLGFFGMILVLHFFVMNAPVWHLISRVDVIGGSTGWHRFAIIDAFMRNVSDWWLTGYTTPTDWAWQMRDVTNQYIGTALSGGLLTLIFFLLVLAWAFGNVGRALKQVPAGPKPQRTPLEWRIWMIGVMLFVHAVTFFGLAYFGQMNMVLYLQLALAGAVGAGLSITASGEDRPREGAGSPADAKSGGLGVRPALAGQRVGRVRL